MNVINLQEESYLMDIEKIVCDYYGSTYDDLRAKNRVRVIVQQRYFIYFFCKGLTKNSLKTMAKRYGQDHATAIHGIKTIKNLLGYDKQIILDHEEMEKKISISPDKTYKKLIDELIPDINNEIFLLIKKKVPIDEMVLVGNEILLLLKNKTKQVDLLKLNNLNKSTEDVA